MKRHQLAIRYLLPLVLLIAEKASADSLYYELPLIEISHHRTEAVIRLPNSEAFVMQADLVRHAPNALLPAVNNIPGVRMEERSPGSYRFSIRGSLLRSPFGVRNVKFYLSDWVMTDAGGNTYLNSLDASSFKSIRILKGPASGLFGANTGGVVIMDPSSGQADSISANLSMMGGSFGLFQEHVQLRKTWKRASLQVSQSFLRSDGYRDHSALDRHFVMANAKWHYRGDAHLKGILIFSNLNYQTPGGLTEQQFMDNPRLSRPATATLPGSAEQNASVFNRTSIVGLSHHKSWSSNFRHVTAVSGNFTDFKNPFITNYEQRKESNLSIRSYAEAEIPSASALYQKITWGLEWQQSFNTVENYGNVAGVKDTLQAADHLRAGQGFVFSRYQVDIGRRMLLEASISLNFFYLAFRSASIAAPANYNRRQFAPQVMPRLSASYQIFDGFSVRGIISRGFSMPTLGEIRASDNVVNETLQAEKGTNIELGVRMKNRDGRLQTDVSFFYFMLNDAIVRRLDDAGSESFFNVGSTRQPGLEWSSSWRAIISRDDEMIQELTLTSALTYNKFRFKKYASVAGNFDGKHLPGTADWAQASSIFLGFRYGISLYLQYNYVGRSALNDANTVFAEPYHLLQSRLGWKRPFKNNAAVEVFVGADNLLNQKYSLGYDLNAVGGRFFNPAPARNFYSGFKLIWLK
jgi:iron complex outermembrane recepter protein